MGISYVAIINNEGPFTWEKRIFSSLSRVPFREFLLKYKQFTFSGVSRLLFEGIF